MYSMKKRIISAIGILSLLGAILIIQPAETKSVDYYSGDAIYHNNSLYIQLLTQVPWRFLNYQMII